MATLDQARAAALALPGTSVEPHHDLESWRVGGRIFATVADDDHLRVMLDPHDTLAAVAEYPDACAPFTWGSRLACMVVTLAGADEALVREFLTDAWRRKAPKKLRPSGD